MAREETEMTHARGQTEHSVPRRDGKAVTAAMARRFSLRGGVIVAVAAAMIVAMALDTEIVVIGSAEDMQDEGFQAGAFGQAEFPGIRDFVIENAVLAPTLAKAVLEDQSAAGAKYGVGDSFGPVVPVTFTGVAGEGKSGIYEIDVAGVPDEVTIRVQTGPAITGTDLRDATGEIEFGQFTNQIEYQDAGAAINDAMKKEVLADLDTASLTGKTVEVTGVFKLINPKNWFVTPVEMSVQ